MNLMTVKEIAGEYQIFDEGAIRWLLFNRSSNGLSQAVVKIGRKVFLDKDAFDNWVSEKREGK